MKKFVKKALCSTLAASMVLACAAPAAAKGPGAKDSDAVTEHEKESAAVSLQLATESAVLLENNNNVLPISKNSKVALYGYGMINPVKGGTGSGAVNNRVVYPNGDYINGTAIASSIIAGFENEGFNIVNKDYLASLEETIEGGAAAGTGMGASNLVAETLIPVNEIRASAAQADTAVYVVRRNAGEGRDRTPTKGDYYLSDAELGNIQLLSVIFDKVVVVLNVVSIDSSWFESSGADALILMGNMGQLSGDAIVKVLDGEVTPSGKLIDTWASDITDFPSTEYFAAINSNDPWSSYIEYYYDDIYVGYRYFDTFAPEKVNYEFGYGKSYTNFSINADSVTVNKGEVTAVVTVKNTGDTYTGKEVVQVYFSAPEGKLDKPYQELIAYAKTKDLAPGESQTLTITFQASEMSSYDESQAAYIMEAGDYTIRIGNSSRNTKPAAVLQLNRTIVTEQLTNQMTIDRDGQAVGGGTGRGTPPYGEHIDISVEENVQNFNNLSEAFKAAGLSGEPLLDTQTTKNTITLNASALENTKNVYPTLSSGQTQEDVNVYISATTEDVDVNGYNYQTNIDYNVNPVYFTADGTQTSTKPANMANYRVKSGSEADGTAVYYTLKDVYDGVLSIEQFVSGMTIEELANMVEGGNKSPNADGQSAGGTSPSTKDITESATKLIDDNWVRGEAGETCGLYVESRLIPNTTNADGPAGLRVTQSYEEDGTTYYQFCTAYPVGQNIAQTWNTEAAYNMGVAVGQDMADAGVDMWLAPGMNIHRNPLCGRNFEYYSEDPLVAGMTSASESLGVQSNPGRGVTIKHYAANNQETSRNASNSVISERALREIYLKGFEIATKTAAPMAVMTSYNEINNVPAANDYELIENILRKEWGFTGVVMTDWGGSGGYSDARAMHAGNDLIMAGRVVSSITGYITDPAPAIAVDANGIATEGGYPYTTMTTRASGTTVTYTTVTQWGDYTPDAENGRDYVVKTTKSAFDSGRNPVRLYKDADGKYYATAPQGVTTTQELQYWTAREMLDGKNGVDGMVAAGTASYTESGDTVTITYKLSKLSARDNVSTGHQTPSTKDIFGDPDENTLTLGDLQKSVINILNAVMQTNSFAKLTGVDVGSYTENNLGDWPAYITVK